MWLTVHIQPVTDPDENAVTTSMNFDNVVSYETVVYGWTSLTLVDGSRVTIRERKSDLDAMLTPRKFGIPI